MEAYLKTPELQKLKKENYKEYRKRYDHYKLRNTPWYCDICNNGKDYKLGGKWSHLGTKKHECNLYNQNNLIKIDFKKLIKKKNLIPII